MSDETSVIFAHELNYSMRLQQLAIFNLTIDVFIKNMMYHIRIHLKLPEGPSLQPYFHSFNYPCTPLGIDHYTTQ